MKLRVGVVGLGGTWESRHRAALRALPDRFEVRAVCAQVAARAEQVAREFQAVPIDGFRALTSRDDVDAVLVLSPDWFGPLPILAACEAGKAVYCAGALDFDPERAAQVRERVEHSGVAFMAEFPRRHAPATLRLKELIATRLGKPRLLFCHARRHHRTQTNGAARHPAPNELRELTELIDWCGYVVGQRPKAVMGVLHSQDEAKSPDYQMMSLEFPPGEGDEAGAIAQVSYSRYLSAEWPEASAFRPPADLQVQCEQGVAFVDLPSSLVWFDEAGRHVESLDSDRPVGEQLLTHFHRAVTSLVRKTSDLDDAYQALTVAVAARRSSLEGQRITLP